MTNILMVPTGMGAKIEFHTPMVLAEVSNRRPIDERSQRDPLGKVSVSISPRARMHCYLSSDLGRMGTERHARIHRDSVRFT